MLRSAASGLGFVCVSMPHKKNARLMWVKIMQKDQWAFISYLLGHATLSKYFGCVDCLPIIILFNCDTIH